MPYPLQGRVDDRDVRIIWLIAGRLALLLFAGKAHDRLSFGVVRGRGGAADPRRFRHAVKSRAKRVIVAANGLSHGVGSGAGFRHNGVVSTEKWCHKCLFSVHLSLLSQVFTVNVSEARHGIWRVTHVRAPRTSQRARNLASRFR